MINSECLGSLEKMNYRCAVNLRYHQTVQWRWGRADQLVRLFVALFAIWDLYCFLKKDEQYGFWAVIGSLLLALLLNIVPFGERELFYGRLFKGWSDIKRDCEALIIKLRTHVVDAETTPDCHERLRELSDRIYALESEEPAPWKGLLSDCQGDENESRHGPGMRTYREIERERERRTSTASQTAPTSLVAAEVDRA